METYMNPEHTAQLEAFHRKIDSCVKDLTEHIVAEEQRVETIESVIFGNEKIGEIGMKKKVDEMHEILVQFKGIKGLFGIIILIGLVVATLKGWVIK